jgi:hypothetical protein
VLGYLAPATPSPVLARHFPLQSDRQSIFTIENLRPAS